MDAGHPRDGKEHFSAVVNALPIPYFKRSDNCVRLATGGSFYIDGSEPEVTTAPFYVEPGAVTGLASNLYLNLNPVLAALQKINGENGKLYLQGYSAHFSFTFPAISSRTAQVAHLLATTANPAIQLFIENRKSSGVMFRHRANGRLEICGDYVPGLENLVSAVAFQATLLSTIDHWLSEGASLDDVKHQLRYSLPPEQVRSCRLRRGYLLPTPEVIQQGRRALLEMHDGWDGRTAARQLSVQELLEHLYQLCEPAAETILSPAEQKLLLAAVERTKKLPIDSHGYPAGYAKVEPVPVNARIAVSPLTKALGNAVQERQVEGVRLIPDYVGWDAVGYSCQNGKQPEKIWVPLKDLVAFDRLVEEHPELLKPLIAKTLTEQQRITLAAVGITDPDRFSTYVPPQEQPADQHHNYLLSFLNGNIIELDQRMENLREERQMYYSSIENIINYSIKNNSKNGESIFKEEYNKDKIVAYTSVLSDKIKINEPKKKSPPRNKRPGRFDKEDFGSELEEIVSEYFNLHENSMNREKDERKRETKKYIP